MSATSRWSSYETADGLEVEIPAAPTLAVVGLFFAAAFGLGIGIFVRSSPTTMHTFYYMELTGCVAGFAMAICIVAWGAFGLERIRLVADALEIRREVMGIGKSRRYDLRWTSNLRVSRSRVKMGEDSVPFTGRGRIAFEYCGKTVSFAAFLPYDNADQIVKELRTRHDFGDER